MGVLASFRYMQNARLGIVQQVPSSLLTEPNKLNDMLPMREISLHKITLPR